MAAPGRVAWEAWRGWALGCRGGLGAGCRLVPAGGPSTVQEHRHGGGHDRGGGGDDGDLPAGHATMLTVCTGGGGPVASRPGARGTGLAKAAGAAAVAASRAVASAAMAPARRRMGWRRRVRFMVTS